MGEYDRDQDGNVVGGLVEVPGGGSVYLRADDPDPENRALLAQSLQIDSQQQASSGTGNIPMAQTAQQGQAMEAQAGQEIYQTTTPAWQQRLDERRRQGRVVSYAGRPGVSPIQMGAAPEDVVDRGQGQYNPAYLPTGRARAVERGIPISEDYAEDLADQTIEQKRQILADEERRTAEAQKVAAITRQQAMQAQTEEAYQREEQRAIAARVAAKEQEYDTLRRGVREGKVDPRRIFSGVGGTFLGIGAAIAQAMGAWAATMSGSPNFAQQIIDGAIQDDIRAQERELDDLGRSANNALGQLERLYGDRDQAKQRLAVLQKEAANMQLQQLSAESGIAAIKSEADAQILAAENQLSAQLEQMRLAALDRERVQYSDAFVQGQRPVAGGSYRRPLTPDEDRAAYRDEVEWGMKTGEVMTGEQKFQADQEVRKAQLRQATQGDETLQTRVEGYGKAVTARTTFDSMLGDVLEKSGAQVRPDGTIQWSDENIGGIGYFDKFRNSPTERAKMKSAVGGLMAAKLHEETGAAISETEQNEMAERIMGEWGTEAEFRNGMEMLQREARMFSERAAATYGLDAAQTFEGRIRTQRSGRAKATAAQQESGYQPPQAR